MKRLIEGYRKFRSGTWPALRDLYHELDAGQTPRVLVVACADSRVDPATIFSIPPGEVFVVRNVANLVPPYDGPVSHHGTSTAVEFAVCAMKVRAVLVLGHSGCGGVSAALSPENVENMSFVSRWIALLDRAIKRLPADSPDPQEALEYESIRVSLENLATFPFVAEAVREGRLTLDGARFCIGTGTLEWLDQETGQFVPIEV